jgi:uncharacterized repeat protein (TIGR03803 family)
MIFRSFLTTCGTFFSGLLMLLLPGDAFAKGNLSVLYAFQGEYNPVSALIADASGNLYGTLENGGAQGVGAVFKLAPNGSFTVLHSFTGGMDGGSPISGLTMDASGNFYGTTGDGGANNFGTVYEITAGGDEVVLHAFAGGSDGAYPWGNVMLDAAGNLYGTTRAGGNGNCTGGYTGCGVVFKIAPSGTEAVLYAFTGTNGDGISPAAGVIADASGNLYGTTDSGGSNTCDCGTVFKLATDGTETILYAFQGGSDGANPLAGLVIDGVGNLYGTTYAGGSNDNCQRSGSTLGCGTVFEISSNGSERVLHSFKSGDRGGYYPSLGSLIFDSAGNLDGTTSFGTANGGTVFQLSPGGSFVVLHAFIKAKQGTNPFGGLYADKSGNLYGTTQGGGSKKSHGGTVYELKK